MEIQSTIISASDFSGENSRYSFLRSNYRPGNVLDIGNIGGVFGNVGKSNSSHLKFVTDAKESVIYGFDLFAPEGSESLYKNQKYGNIEKELPYEDKFFDTVYLGELIEHLSNPGFALEEISRVLKDDGILILDTPNAYSLHKFFKYVFQREENMGDVTHVIIFTPASLKALLLKNKFKINVLSEKRSGILNKIPFTKGLGTHLLVAAQKFND